VVTKVDINCDLGESFGRFTVGYDAKIMPFITSANVACGFHAGDPNIMAKTVKLAMKNGVAVGAHPGYPDLIGFGRRDIELSKDEIKNIILYQVGALRAFTNTNGLELQHVKPHGALYNMAVKDRGYADVVIDALKSLDSRLILLALAGSEWATKAENVGLRVAQEVFADRAYNSDGSLVSRRTRGAIIENPKLVGERAIKMVTEREVETVDGYLVKFEKIHTICVHGDTLHAVELAKTIHDAFESEGVDLVPLNKLV
jgi:UPF0271 protein